MTLIDGDPAGCKCGPACEMPCWQRIGMTDQKCCPGCAELPQEQDDVVAALDRLADAGRGVNVSGPVADLEEFLDALDAAEVVLRATRSESGSKQERQED